MRCTDPGHTYYVPNLEAEGEQKIVFIKRSSKMVKHAEEYPGSNTQELIRVLIDRTKYLYDVGPCEETGNAIEWLRMALYEYEARAWRRKIQKLNREANPEAITGDLDVFRSSYSDVPFTSVAIEHLPTGPDGHIIIKTDMNEVLHACNNTER